MEELYRERACSADEVLKCPRKWGGLSPLTRPGVGVQISSFCEMMVLRKEGASEEPVPTGYY